MFIGCHNVIGFLHVVFEQSLAKSLFFVGKLYVGSTKMHSRCLVNLILSCLVVLLFVVNILLQASLSFHCDIIMQHGWCIHEMNSWNVQIWNSVDPPNWEGKSILNTCAMQSSALLHGESHLGPFAFTSLILWFVSLSLYLWVCVPSPLAGIGVRIGAFLERN